MFPEYFYDLTTAMFLDGYENVFMDRNQFALKAAPKDLGTDVLVALSDLRKVWAPYMTVEEDEKARQSDTTARQCVLRLTAM